MKNARQTAILSIIEQYDVETQEELAGHRVPGYQGAAPFEGAVRFRRL